MLKPRGKKHLYLVAVAREVAEYAFVARAINVTSVDLLSLHFVLDLRL